MYAFAEFLGSKFLKIRVDADYVMKPLRRGLRINVDGKPKWISHQYVKLLDFCYACGLMGHVYKGCSQGGESAGRLKTKSRMEERVSGKNRESTTQASPQRAAADMVEDEEDEQIVKQAWSRHLGAPVQAAAHCTLKPSDWSSKKFVYIGKHIAVTEEKLKNVQGKPASQRNLDECLVLQIKLDELRK
ncbi:hypothetical protein Cgig2_003006 [Carnegiea gigantea]|uniref:CCHC-type domain-containing protein n=1 Tax=Carnegiea gigantea TaxID=171969 RepID=A0A9Q1GKK1_9CARY|nr:hypothetical protein Cgig2_003006 [Carnegiea gigantea]